MKQWIACAAVLVGLGCGKKHEAGGGATAGSGGAPGPSATRDEEAIWRWNMLHSWDVTAVSTTTEAIARVTAEGGLSYWAYRDEQVVVCYPKSEEGVTADSKQN